MKKMSIYATKFLDPDFHRPLNAWSKTLRLYSLRMLHRKIVRVTLERHNYEKKVNG